MRDGNVLAAGSLDAVRDVAEPGATEIIELPPPKALPAGAVPSPPISSYMSISLGILCPVLLCQFCLLSGICRPLNSFWQRQPNQIPPR